MHPESPLNLLPNRYTASVTVRSPTTVRTTARRPPACSARFRQAAAWPTSPACCLRRTSTDAGRAQELLVGREILDALAVQQGLVTDASGNDEILDARKRLTESLERTTSWIPACW